MCAMHTLCMLHLVAIYCSVIPIFHYFAFSSLSYPINCMNICPAKIVNVGYQLSLQNFSGFSAGSCIKSHNRYFIIYTSPETVTVLCFAL